MGLRIPGYSFERKIGKGGMALVYLAVQKNFGRKVAIKILVPGAEEEKDYAKRFMQEAKTVATLNHPHIIPVYDVGQVDAYYYIAMEYLPGNTLKQWIHSGLEIEEALQICCEMAEALHYAHKKGFVHRDIKPENIMFREDNSAVLTDFGIARSSHQDTDLTQEGTMIGTPAYMSPEQARAKAVDGRSDIYSLGVVLYEMLTRQRPYQADDAMGVALAHISDPVPELPSHLQQYQFLIDQMMAKQPENRFDNALALAKAIKGLLHGEMPAVAPAVKAPQQAQPVTRPVQPQSVASEPESKAKPAVALSVVGEAEQSQGLDVAMPEMTSEPIPGFSLPSRNMVVTEAKVKKGLLSKVSRLEIVLVSDDSAQFNVQFSQVSQRILDWYGEQGKKAKVLAMQFYCKPWMSDMIETSLAHLLETDDPYGFLKKVQINLAINDLNGHALLSKSFH